MLPWGTINANRARTGRHEAVGASNTNALKKHNCGSYSAVLMIWSKLRLEPGKVFHMHLVDCEDYQVCHMISNNLQA